MSKTYQTRLGCDNCGHNAIYEIPNRHLITNYCGCEEHRIYSSYERINGSNNNLLICKNCDLACLIVMSWEEITESVNA